MLSGNMWLRRGHGRGSNLTEPEGPERPVPVAIMQRVEGAGKVHAVAAAGGVHHHLPPSVLHAPHLPFQQGLQGVQRRAIMQHLRQQIPA